MVCRLSGSARAERELASKNALVLIVVNCEPGSKVTDLRDGISLNAPSPIVVTLLGITMLSSLGTPLKACVSIVVSWLFGAKVMDSRALYWNAALPIVVTLLGILI
jgi:hypothetical protein